MVDRIVVAAKQLEDSGKRTFSAEDLVVAAWQNFPDVFGLSGYLDGSGTPMYPNSNRVYAEIMGSKPVRKMGLLRKVGSKMYRLTEAGRQRANGAAEQPLQGTTEKLAFAREQIDQIRRLFESRAAEKIRAEKLDDVSFFDACGFWGLSAHSRANALWSKFADIEALLDAAEQSLGDKKEITTRHGSITLRGEDIARLRHAHTILQERFQEDLEIIKKRTDERKQ